MPSQLGRIFFCLCLQLQSPTHSLKGRATFSIRSGVFPARASSLSPNYAKQFSPSPKPVHAIILNTGTYKYPFGLAFWVFRTMLSFSQFIFIGALVSSLAGTRLVAKSVTVDDADATKIIYSTGWNIGNKCLACFAKPNETQAYEGTWHEWVWLRRMFSWHYTDKLA